MRSFKTCSRCNLVKTTLAFNLEHKAPDGLAGRCRECEKAVQAERRAAKAANVPRDDIGDAIRGWGAATIRPDARIACSPSSEVWAL